jgi:hypothetical protein
VTARHAAGHRRTRRPAARRGSALPAGEDQAIKALAGVLVTASGAGQYEGRHRNPDRDGWDDARDGTGTQWPAAGVAR